MAKQKKEKDTKPKSLEKTIDKIKQQFGDGAIMKLKEVRAVNVDAVPTGSISLDMALGVGGVPRGCLLYTSPSPRDS